MDQNKENQPMHGHKNSITLNQINSTIDTIDNEDIIVGQQQLPSIPYKRNLNDDHHQAEFNSTNMSQRSQQPRIRQSNVRFTTQNNYNTIQTESVTGQQVYARELTQETPNGPSQGQMNVRKNIQMSNSKNTRNQNYQFSSSKKQPGLPKSSQRCQSEIGAYPHQNSNIQKPLNLQEQNSSSRARQTGTQFNTQTLTPSQIMKKKQIHLSRQQQTYENAVKQIRQSLDSHSRISKVPPPTNQGVSAAQAKKFRNFHQNLAKSQHQTIDVSQQSHQSNLELTNRISQNSKLFGQMAVNSEMQKQQFQNSQILEFQNKRNTKNYMNKSIDFGGISSYESMNFRGPPISSNFQSGHPKSNKTSQNMPRFHSQLQQFSGGESPINGNSQSPPMSRDNDYQQKYFKERLLSEQMSKHIVQLEKNYNEILDQNEQMKQRIQALESNQEQLEQNRQNEDKIEELSSKLKQTQEALSLSDQANVNAQTSLLEVEQKLQEAEQEQNNSIINNELELSNLNTKNKLLEDALTRRNVDVEQAEENNRQLLNLLEKYDNKLDELQEDNELKDMKIFEYERVHLGDRPKIKIESIEDKVKFLVMVLKRLRVMYIEEAQERIDLIKKEQGIENIQYPLLPTEDDINEMNEADKRIVGQDVTLDQATSKILKDMRLIEGNRQIREQYQEQIDADTDTINEGNGSKILSDSNSHSNHHLSPNQNNTHQSSKKSEIWKLKNSKASLARDMSKKDSSKAEHIETINISHQDI